MPIKIGIIGMGRMGITHYSIINSHSKVVIDSIVEPSSFILSMMNKYFPVKTFKDFNLLFTEEKPDAILVCTPPNMHYPIIKKAAEFGIHVFVEKPFTTKYKEASELSKLFLKNNLVNQVGYVFRFNDIFIKVKEYLKLGVIGKTIRFKSEMFSGTITRPNNGSSWRDSRESGGGAMYEMASHAIDLVNFLIGNPDKIIGSSLNQVYSKKVEDVVSSTFLYNNGLTGLLYVNWSDSSYRKPINIIELFGSGGRIIANQHTLKIFLNKNNKKLALKEGWNVFYITDIAKPVPFYVRGNEYTRQLYHFINCIIDKKKTNHCSFSDGLNTLKIIDNIYNDCK
ncbi:MAG: hypothetical protein CMG69_03830 [Candidatus Marinimicrobia bacterium]|nr:hypothetical protein [Candidatus Neomarinimicrobiota bacterium]|tara:strand:+ start:70870 stop:71886 length:1017 start_codon:yes stop_codon:yes gene_type:complete